MNRLSSNALGLVAYLFGGAIVVQATSTPDNIPQARVLFNQGHFDEARASFSRIAQEEPKNAEAQYFLGIIALQNGDAKSAAQSLKKAVELKPGTSEYLRRLGDAYGDLTASANLFSVLGVALKSKRAYESAVAADPVSIRALWSLMEYCRVAPGIAGGSKARAYAIADEIRKLDVKAGRWARAQVLLGDNRPEEAFTLYDGILEAELPDYPTLYQLGIIAQRSERHFDRGLEALQQCLKLSPTPFHPWFDEDDHARVYFMIGQIQEKRGETAAARAAYEAALMVDQAFAAPRDALKKLRE